ncbi:MAG: hypothetical protein ACFNS8_05265 [Kingella oralis]
MVNIIGRQGQPEKLFQAALGIVPLFARNIRVNGHHLNTEAA